MKPGPLVFINMEDGNAVKSHRTAEDLIKAENTVDVPLPKRFVF